MSGRLSRRVEGFKIRFRFPKTDDVLREAGERLQKLRTL